ncbi:thiamine pyrophosphate-dependent dehydrogenase E1 component subunit alpha [Neomoorella mulderi]|uniref:Acetoin:2,6-dichlorophenolindophenol oxidoreductase subunit alpha n=1 Tax=Moorella mulderi DSM 14980 TaxID=1122241 RepID=A0A151AYJ6_9FIRM|nr:thiamine pyrophosphate-dependent dehydrogenase E1 component subunit alpha [Moorella mulderi]KYH32729.1 acetoin:2,6-dichlorophenolindophenol oxidoreductase subunit alpha [Moorella mulderi DSM 14980]
MDVTTSLSKEQLTKMYYDMWIIRNFEENLLDLYQKNLAYGGMHVSVGEEAIAVGACANLKREDTIVTSHRGHGHCIAKGADLKGMMAELLARKNGLCKGKGGSQHIVDMSVGVLGAQGIVGAGCGIAVGSALSFKIRGQKNVCVNFFGDGAANTGSFHESLNMAALYSLPVVFICENNGYAVSTSFARSTKIDKISVRAGSYGMPGVTIDGNNIFEVYKTVGEAVERARQGDGPTLIEAVTYRWYGHYVGDPCTYRPPGELERWKEKDPILFLEKYLLANKLCCQEEIDGLKAAAGKAIAEALDYALASPEPEPADLFTDVYFEK